MIKRDMEVKTVEIKESYVSMTFVPKDYDDIVMAETLFGNIVAEQFGQEVFEPFPYERSSFTEDEISRMISSSETTFSHNPESGFKMTVSSNRDNTLTDFHQDDKPFKRLEDFQLVDKFWLKCIQPEEDIKDGYGWIDVLYQIQLGEHTLESNISEWTTDWDQIRHDMEHLIWHDETEIDLNFEDSPTRIILSKKNALDSTVEIYGGIYFNWETLVKIEVIPNEFERECKPVSGYGRLFDVVTAIYNGLQGLAYAYPEENEENKEMTKGNVKNKLHSPMLDEYIESLKRDITQRARTKALQLDSLRRENEMKTLDSLREMIQNQNISAQVKYLTNCDVEKAKVLYLTRVKIYTEDTWDVVLPEPKDEYINSVAIKAATTFYKELENGLNTEEAHKKACWYMDCELDHYRIKL